MLLPKGGKQLLYYNLIYNCTVLQLHMQQISERAGHSCIGELLLKGGTTRHGGVYGPIINY